MSTPYPADLQQYLHQEQASENYFDTISLIDYTAYTWAYIAYFFHRLDQASLSASEEHKYARQISNTIRQYHGAMSQDYALQVAHPRRIACFYVEQIIQYRAKTLPYYVMPDLTLLHDDSKESGASTEQIRKAFWLGWGV